MNERPVQIAKREMQTLSATPGVWIGLGAVGLILGLAGPFGTEVLPVLPRLVYWVVVAAIGFFLGSLVATFVAESLRALRVGLWPAVVIAGAAAGVANLLALLAVNWFVFRLTLSEPGYLAALGINVIIISIIIAGAYVSIERTMTRGSTRASTRILDRLPIEKRGPLISLSVQDHYVEVATTKGTELVLLRLSDAMAEVGDTPGLQVHRSHWIATGAVKSARRDGARAILTMADGRDIPVSRTYLPAIKEAGLLPR
ncbi:LytTR family DNA-binding domain-containing protein [Maritimibacter dapengensis]|uniref:LytTR family transcriptional regulator n=1 Tax=Maritimibacter dapengensis TaxID=2836868 RepID=A0ABS6T0F6_9RHOB|nr:LytTR family transcriptional regulator [Maritimibacter dapengensis]